jgi:GMP synthase (glutamine-hydrolysing)
VNAHDSILILDFGSQYTKLIARRIREQDVYCEIWPFDTPIEKIAGSGAKGLILSGGPASVLDKGSPNPSASLLNLDIPVLGICYGFQWMTHISGGSVEHSDHREYGHTKIHKHSDDKLLDNIPEECDVWMSHGDRILSLPSGFENIATSDSTPFAAARSVERDIWGVQFHPEVVHTQFGKQILKNFVQHICGCKATWTMSNYVHRSIEAIKASVQKDEQVLCGLSGGVDSSVVAALLLKAIPDQVTCVFVDHGLLRAGEREQVEHVFRDQFHANLVVVEAEKLFLEALAGTEEPEAKRDIIKKKFVEVFLEEAKKIKGVRYLAQGTLYPDVIESSKHGGPSVTIKSHHNVGIEELLGLELIEPLRELFKDEVRDLGRELGLDEVVVDRHPFPGPGLGIRCLGPLNKARLDTLRHADRIALEEIRNADWYSKIWQALTVLLPVRSVGVMGDARTYEEVIALRCVDSVDGMTADWVDLPKNLLRSISNRIINEVHGVNRVVYDISSKPPATIEWE